MAWFSESWKYRKPFIITNANAVSATQYQIRIVIDHAALVTAGLSEATGYDILFTDEDGSQQLHHWIEPETIDTSSCAIWVLIPYIPASGQYSGFMYYGNPSSLNQSDGENTFEFFDDFSGYTSANFSYGEAYGGYSAADYYPVSGILDLQGSGAWRIFHMERAWTDSVASPANLTCYTRFQPVAYADINWHMNYFVKEGSVNTDRFGIQFANDVNGAVRVQWAVDGGGYNYSATITNLANDTWYKSEVTIRETTCDAKVFNDNYTQRGSTYTQTQAGWDGDTWTWVTWIYDDNQDHYYDWIVIRKYANVSLTTVFSTQEEYTETVIDWVLKITKPGIAIENANKEDYVLDTTQNRLKTHMIRHGFYYLDEYNPGECSEDGTGTPSFTIQHNLGYYPMVWFYIKDEKDGYWHRAPIYTEYYDSSTPGQSRGLAVGYFQDPDDVNKVNFFVSRAPAAYEGTGSGGDCNCKAMIEYKVLIFINPNKDTWFK